MSYSKVSQHPGQRCACHVLIRAAKNHCCQIRGSLEKGGRGIGIRDLCWENSVPQARWSLVGIYLGKEQDSIMNVPRTQRRITTGDAARLRAEAKPFASDTMNRDLGSWWQAPRSSFPRTGRSSAMGCELTVSFASSQSRSVVSGTWKVTSNRDWSSCGHERYRLARLPNL